jgi:hypothetical protein
MIFSLIVVVSISKSRNFQKFNSENKKIKIHDIEPQVCTGTLEKDSTKCEEVYNVLKDLLTPKKRSIKSLKDINAKKLKEINIKDDADDLLDAANDFVAECHTTKCSGNQNQCKTIFGTKLTTENIENALSGFIAACDPTSSTSGGGGDDNVNPQSESDASDGGGDDNVKPDTGDQQPGSGYEKWNKKEIKILMILTNLIGLLYFLS